MSGKRDIVMSKMYRVTLTLYVDAEDEKDAKKQVNYMLNSIESNWYRDLVAKRTRKSDKETETNEC